MTSVKIYPHAILSTPGTSGYYNSISYLRVLIGVLQNLPDRVSYTRGHEVVSCGHERALRATKSSSIGSEKPDVCPSERELSCSTHRFCSRTIRASMCPLRFVSSESILPSPLVS